MKHIVILGGGTGGALTANLLAHKLDPESARITVVSSLSRHYYQPGWLYTAFGREDVRKLSKPVRELLHDSIALITEDISALDTAGRTVTLANGDTLAFDFLVIATGSNPCPEDIPGLAEGGHHFYTQEASLKLYAALQEFRGGRIITGVGGLPYKCPVAPLEFTFLLDDYLIEQGLRGSSTITYTFPIGRPFTIQSISDMAGVHLAERGIGVETMFNLENVDTERKIAMSLEGTELPYDLLVLIPPHRGAKFLQGHPIADSRGWVKTDRHTLQVPGQDAIFALGDATDLPISKAGSTAHFQAPVVAEHILAAIGGRELNPKKSSYGGHVMCFLEVGNNKATILDFDYEHPPEPKDPNMLMHYLKMGFNKAYFHLVPTGVA